MDGSRTLSLGISTNCLFRVEYSGGSFGAEEEVEATGSETFLLVVMFQSKGFLGWLSFTDCDVTYDVRES